MKRKKGISLIVLIITIVVIVILATAVILSIANNNPIENASEAVEKNNRAEYESELSLYIAKQYAETDPSTELRYVVYDEITDKITSMTAKDKENYIIWQGELYKKEETSDGIRYVNSDGKIAKFLDEETEVTEKMIEFLKAFNEKQEELDKDEQLLYNGGYITGIKFGANVNDFKEALGYEKDIYIKSSSASLDSDSIKEDSERVISGDQICIKIDESDNEYELLAKAVVYGDLGTIYLISTATSSRINYIIAYPEESSVETKISADLNHDGIINSEDANFVYKILGGKSRLEQKVFAKVPTVK